MSIEYELYKSWLLPFNREPGDAPLAGASMETLKAAEDAIGFKIPVDVRAWLATVNGAYVGGSWLMGVEVPNALLDIAYTLSILPEWKENRWIPVASDGCGNYYVLVAESDTNPVGFVDFDDDPMVLTFIASSNFKTFLRCFINSAIHEDDWPFDMNDVLKKDPDLVQIQLAPLPWEA